MQLPHSIIMMIKERSNLDINSPKAFYSLALDICDKTGEKLGENTLRRLTGALKDDREPRRHTLDVVARYLSHPDWKSLLKSLNEEDSRLDACIEMLHTPDLATGDCVEVKWHPGRKVVLEKKEGNLFVVKSSENAKLHRGDTLHVSAVAKGFPFLAGDVVRGGEHIGDYVAAEENGVSSIKKA